MHRAAWLVVFLLACSTETPDPAMRTIRGVATGLDGPIVVDLNNRETLKLEIDGPFEFETQLPEGATFWFTVVSRPDDVLCHRVDPTGTVGGDDVALGIECAPAAFYRVGGTVSGAAGSVDLDVGGTIVTVDDGLFVLPGLYRDEDPYSVAIAHEPAGQTCEVAHGSGLVPDAHVTDVAVTCVTDTWTIGGTVSGATGELTLRNNGGDDLVVPGDGEFTFATALVEGAAYAVSVESEPPGQDCFVTADAGEVGAADVTSVAVQCETVPTHAITSPNGGEIWVAGDTVSVDWTPLAAAVSVDVELLAGGTVVATLADDTADDGAFEYTIPLTLDPGAAYTVRVTPSVGLADVSDATFAVAALVTYVWNGSAEDIVRVDPFTGATFVIGQAGDLQYWSGNTAVDHDAGVLYVEASSPKKLHEIDVATGDYLGSTVPADGLMGLVVAPDGALLYGKWDGTNSEEELWRIDPDTGVPAQLGTIGTLKSWHGRMFVRDGALYVPGYDGPAKRVWKMDPLTGDLLDTITLADGVQGLQVRADGVFLYVRWNGTAEELRVYDPVAETDSLLGLVGDLAYWSMGVAIDVANDRIFVFGSTSSARKVYVLDTTDGTLLASPTLPFNGSPNAADLVY